MPVSKEVSNLLNLLIKKMTDPDTKYSIPHSYKTFNGTCIPFIGPYWKNVDFSSDHCHVARIKPASKNISKIYVGFNQHPQFEDYPYFTLHGKEWDIIIGALVGLYKEVNSERPSVESVDLWLSKVHDNLYEFSQTFEIIEN